MMNFCGSCLVRRRIGGGERGDRISIHKATPASWLFDADTELEHVILPSSCEPENLQPGTYRAGPRTHCTCHVFTNIGSKWIQFHSWMSKHEKQIAQTVDKVFNNTLNKHPLKGNFRKPFLILG